MTSRLPQIAAGLSPRGRGKPQAPYQQQTLAGSIPAWAGETLAKRAYPAAEMVYPRVGGGNTMIKGNDAAGMGLSPRGRGKPMPSGRRSIERRSIPAWAGETETLGYLLYPIGVYPRVGGGNRLCAIEHLFAGGLSPRGRGKRQNLTAAPTSMWSIPAWAGETNDFILGRNYYSVYPRVGGGNRRRIGIRIGDDGLSPRGRGKLIMSDNTSPITRSIPAWAGETAVNICMLAAYKVYPRVGGGNPRFLKHLSNGGGLSPRGRGKQISIAIDHLLMRSIPAWAGETALRDDASDTTKVYPRVGGGNGVFLRFYDKCEGLSPRGRGKRSAAGRPVGITRSIPAWAGETRTRSWAAALIEVYPRVGGGNQDWRRGAIFEAGLSPRGRGKRRGSNRGAHG